MPVHGFPCEEIVWTLYGDGHHLNSGSFIASRFLVRILRAKRYQWLFQIVILTVLARKGPSDTLVETMESGDVTRHQLTENRQPVFRDMENRE